MRTRFFTLLAALGCMIATIVIEGIPSINKKIEICLEKAVIEEYNQRLYSLNKVQNTPENPNRKVKEYNYYTEEGKKAHVFADSIPVATADRLVNQYVMGKYCPLNPTQLNHIFKERLTEEGIKGETGIYYKGNKGATASDNPEKPPHFTYTTKDLSIDHLNTYSVQAWTSYSLITVIKQTNLFLLCMAFLFPILSVGCFRRFAKKKQPKLIETDTNENQPTDASRPFSEIELDFRNNQIIIYGQSYHLAPKSMEVLNLFLTAPNNMLTCDDIRKSLWEKSSLESGKRNVYTHITNIRNIIKQAGPYYIATDKEKYVLVYTDQSTNLSTLPINQPS